MSVAYRIAIVLKNRDRIQTYCPGEWPTEIAAKAEIMARNASFPLAPGLERVVLAPQTEA
jgi:hypothetical protein